MKNAGKMCWINVLDIREKKHDLLFFMFLP